LDISPYVYKKARSFERTMRNFCWVRNKRHRTSLFTC